jgi:hypothetical protein
MQKRGLMGKRIYIAKSGTGTLKIFFATSVVAALNRIIYKKVAPAIYLTLKKNLLRNKSFIRLRWYGF